MEWRLRFRRNNETWTASSPLQPSLRRCEPARSVLAAQIRLSWLLLDHREPGEHGEAPSVAHPHFDWVLADVAVTTENLDGAVGDHHGHVHGSDGCQICLGARSGFAS